MFLGLIKQWLTIFKIRPKELLILSSKYGGLDVINYDNKLKHISYR